MATNRVHKDGAQLSLPVPANTASGTPLLISALRAVTLTAEGGGGNPDGFATVQLFPSPVYRFNVDEAVAAVGDPVYINADGGLTSAAVTGTVDNTFFGYALDTKGAGVGEIRVKLAAGAA